MSSQMARRHAFGISLPSWTAETTNYAPGPSDKCHRRLRDLSVLFHEIDLAVLEEITFDQNAYQRFRDPKDVPANSSLRASTRFPESDEDVKSFQNAVKNIERLSEKEKVNEYLRDTSYLNLLSRASVTILEAQGDRKDYERARWSIAKQKASVFLRLRDKCADIFKEIEEELIRSSYDQQRLGIWKKIQGMDGFLEVFNRQPPHGPRELLWVAASEGTIPQDKGVSIAYSQAQQNRNLTLIAVVFAGTMLSFIPTIFAWHRATDAPGSIRDVDFWLLIQSSAMQLLGLFTSIYPLARRQNSPSWLWARVFLVLGASCSIAAILLYIYAATMWSALMSFLGSASQAGMALLLALMAESVGEPVKRN